MASQRHRFTPARLADVWVIESDLFQDERGTFAEVYNFADFGGHGIPDLLPIANWSRSQRRVLRGLHWQGPRNAMGKLVRCSFGRIYDVIVDLRAGSPSFCQWQAWELSDRSCTQVWVPPGFAHGFVAQSEFADISYQCSAYHDNTDEGTIAWDDPDLAIPWPEDHPILSARDQAGMAIRAYRQAPVFSRP
jgi:dTDP-4-dehydrorhamnose 3,5-epimerase